MLNINNILKKIATFSKNKQKHGKMTNIFNNFLREKVKRQHVGVISKNSVVSQTPLKFECSQGLPRGLIGQLLRTASLI